MSHVVSAEKDKSPESERQEYKGWLEERVKQSRDAKGMDDSPGNNVKLRAVHSQLRTEAERLGASRLETSKPVAASVKSFQAPQPSGSAEGRTEGTLQSDLDKIRIGHITLYCECLMGVSIVTVKLAHARFDHYLKSNSMQEDAYLFVSTSQIKKTMDDVNSLPRMNIN